MPLRLVSYNIHRCYGSAGYYDPESIKAVIDSLDAHVIALQEVELPLATLTCSTFSAPENPGGPSCLVSTIHLLILLAMICCACVNTRMPETLYCWAGAME